MIYLCSDIDMSYPYEELERYVSIERKVKALKYVERKDYALSLLAYCLLKVGIYEETGISLADYTTFIYYGNNKPRIEGIDKHFNMSHCMKCVAAVISDYEVGIDVESDKNVTQNLINFTMNKNEVLKIKNDMSYFYRYWTNKESYLKLTGKGIDVLLTSLDFSNYDSDCFDFKSIHFFSKKEKEYSLTVCSNDETFDNSKVKSLSFKQLIVKLEEIK